MGSSSHTYQRAWSGSSARRRRRLHARGGSGGPLPLQCPLSVFPHFRYSSPGGAAPNISNKAVVVPRRCGHVFRLHSPCSKRVDELGPGATAVAKKNDIKNWRPPATSGEWLQETGLGHAHWTAAAMRECATRLFACAAGPAFTTQSRGRQILGGARIPVIFIDTCRHGHTIYTQNTQTHTYVQAQAVCHNTVSPRPPASAPR